MKKRDFQEENKNIGKIIGIVNTNTAEIDIINKDNTANIESITNTVNTDNIEMLGIVISTSEEFEEILKKHLAYREPKLKNLLDLLSEISDHNIRVGYLNSIPVDIIISGTGKVNAAMATQLLLSTGQCKTIINIGICGATERVYNRKRAAVIDKVIERDFDTRVIDRENFHKHKINLYNSATHNTPTYNILYTADSIATDNRVFDEEVDGYFDMEGFAVAKVCSRYGVKCIIIKSAVAVVDSPIESDNNIETIDTEELFGSRFKEACKLAAEELERVLESLIINMIN